MQFSNIFSVGMRDFCCSSPGSSSLFITNFHMPACWMSSFVAIRKILRSNTCSPHSDMINVPCLYSRYVINLRSIIFLHRNLPLLLHNFLQFHLYFSISNLLWCYFRSGFRHISLVLGSFLIFLMHI